MLIAKISTRYAQSVNALSPALQGIDNDPIKDTEKLEKLKTIKSQMLKLRETRNEARNRYDAAIDDGGREGRAGYQRTLCLCRGNRAVQRRDSLSS